MTLYDFLDKNLEGIFIGIIVIMVVYFLYKPTKDK